MAARHEALVRIVTEIGPCSVRGAFYQATVRGVVEKSEAGYGRVQRALVALRRSGAIAYRDIADGTRWQIKPASHCSLRDALNETAALYRRALWHDVNAHLEVWLEKDALAGVIHPITNTYDVPLMVSRGFSSLSFLYSAAADIVADNKPAFIFHLGDHDPSGVCAALTIEKTLREFVDGQVELHFQRLAVLPDQIEAWRLPGRPTKKTDTRAGTFHGESVELDSIHPDLLRQLVEDAITKHLPEDQLHRLSRVEAEERTILEVFARNVAA